VNNNQFQLAAGLYCRRQFLESLFSLKGPAADFD
jgi:hypothetical protein